MTDSVNETYNTAELYALQVLRACAAETTEGTPAGETVITAVNELLARHEATGLGCLVAALGRFGAMGLGEVATSNGESLAELLERFEWHKLEQHEHDRTTDDTD
ncbi:hypothetical protein [Actinopolyspora halophila]|uniref:hypothetical protein n=1 Tax=Actinopolyspora halophila TaxID=1850 RepID=UPI00037B5BA1|nr:hypothetical protein [Actinopolyspora halophila]